MRHYGEPLTDNALCRRPGQLGDVLMRSQAGPRLPCNLLGFIQGTHCIWKTGKIVTKIPCQGKHREFGNFAKTQGKHIWFAQGVNSLILKRKDIWKFAEKISKLLFEVCQVSFVYVIVTNHVNCHRKNCRQAGKTQGI